MAVTRRVRPEAHGRVPGVTDVEYPCPQCGLPLTKVAGWDGYECIACVITWSGTAMAMVAYPDERVCPRGHRGHAPEAKFCVECGATLGAEYTQVWEVCPKCGLPESDHKYGDWRDHPGSYGE